MYTIGCINLSSYFKVKICLYFRYLWGKLKIRSSSILKQITCIRFFFNWGNFGETCISGRHPDQILLATFLKIHDV